MSRASGPRRYLIATVVAHYKNQPAWDRPQLVSARQDVIDLFTRRLGYEHVSDLGVDPTQAQLTEQLREFCTSDLLGEDDLVAVYLGCHGELLEEELGGGHVLLTHDTAPGDIPGALATEQLARTLLLGTRVRRLLLMLDTCYSARGGHEITAAALKRIENTWPAAAGSGLAIVSSAQPMETADVGYLPQRLQEAVQDLSTAGHAPQTLALDAVVTRINRDSARQRVGLTLVGLSGPVPPFLANPRHDDRLAGLDLALQQDLVWREEAERREVELVQRMLVRARANYGEGGGWWFAGRTTALHDVGAWLAGTGQHLPASALAVTAGPGSGKTAVLGLFAALAHPEIRATVPVFSLDLPPGTQRAAEHIDVAIYAQVLTDDQVLGAIAAAARVPDGTVGELLAALEGRPQPLTVLIDGLDEAASPQSLCSTVLRPMIAHACGRIRFLFGTRPHLLPLLELDRGQHVDLDAERYADPAAVRAYAARNLISSHPHSPYAFWPGSRLVPRVAAAVAEAAGRSFLVTRLSASALAASPLPTKLDTAWRASLPRHADRAMAADLTQRLGPRAAVAMDLLTPLAYAEGQGLPWEDLWADIATTASGHLYTDADLHWLRREAGSYIVEATEDDRSAYRLYHQALADYLRTRCEGSAVHTAIARTLLDHVPLGPDGSREWARAHPYTLRHLALHAAAGGILDDVLTDPEYLVHADPDHLVPQLTHATAPQARLVAAVYRHSRDHHTNATPDQRRRLLAIDAARYNAPALRDALNHHTPADTWIPAWSTGSSTSPALLDILTGHSGPVRAVACTVLDGRPAAVTAGDYGSVRVWDLSTGTLVGEPLTGHTGSVRAVACTVLDGRPAAVTAGDDRSVRVWDLATGTLVGEPLTGHTGPVFALACTVLDGRPAAVTADHASVWVWDLATGTRVGEPLIVPTGPVFALACTVLDGRPVAITASDYGSVWVWDLATGTRVGKPLIGHTGKVFVVACTVLDGRPAAITASEDRSVRVWDLTTGTLVGEPLTGHSTSVSAVACTVLDGRPAAITAGDDGSVRVWDLTTGTLVGEPLTGHTGSVRAVACTVLDGRPAAITASHDRSVRVWDLTTGTRVGKPLTGHTGKVRAVACTVLDGRPAAVTAGDDRSVRVWDLATGTRVGEPLTGHTEWVTAVACTVLDGRPAAITASYDCSVRVWDLTTGTLLHEPLTGHTEWVSAVACTVLDGRPTAITACDDRSVRVWDLTTGTLLHEPLTGHTEWVSAVACTVLDGRPTAVTAGDGSVRVWDLTTGTLVGEPLTGQIGLVSAVACTVLDGRPVAVTADHYGSVRVWDLATGTLVGEPLTGHTGLVSAVACTVLDGRPTAVTACDDRSVRVWDLTTRTCIDAIPIHANALTVIMDRLIITTRSDVATFHPNPGVSHPAKT
ncbi:hypothetical protein ACIRLA_08085 [Streptomyces sp. NPDC102364]|uniref:hypothetical protein n=1 Tax=Streptomyces sp. NPDC102364 TaxID=3366161 RepID=UPI0038158F26